MGEVLPRGGAALLLFAQPQHALGAEHCGVASGDKRPVQPAALGDVRAAGRRVRCLGLDRRENERCSQQAPKASVAGAGSNGLQRLLRRLGACFDCLNGWKPPTQNDGRLPNSCVSVWAHRPLSNSLLEVLWGGDGEVIGRGEPLPLRKNSRRSR
eukprot:scaffold119360_cov57-Phaeocystis_antarctica.AAC.4